MGIGICSSSSRIKRLTGSSSELPSQELGSCSGHPCGNSRVGKSQQGAEVVQVNQRRAGHRRAHLQNLSRQLVVAIGRISLYLRPVVGTGIDKQVPSQSGIHFQLSGIETGNALLVLLNVLEHEIHLWIGGHGQIQNSAQVHSHVVVLFITQLCCRFGSKSQTQDQTCSHRK